VGELADHQRRAADADEQRPLDKARGADQPERQRRRRRRVTAAGGAVADTARDAANPADHAVDGRAADGARGGDRRVGRGGDEPECSLDDVHRALRFLVSP
jgi:hypothetical protein